MRVSIRGKEYEYESDFPVGWKFSKGDDFKYPVAIGPYTCFIKRFARRTRDISGWNLLHNLTGALEETLQKVYALNSEEKNNQEVHYAFFEYVTGQDLGDLIEHREEINLQKLTDELFTGLQIVQAQAYWLPDFCEKNILYNNKDGHFLLIDLDSAYPLSALPEIAMWGDKYYWAHVVNFCRDILNYKDVLPAHFNGASFNYLHVIFLILRLKIFYSGEVNDYDDREFFGQLPKYLNNISASFKDVFKKVYQNREQPLQIQEIAAIKELISKDIIPLSTDRIRTIIKEKPVVELPVIHQFEASHYLEKTADKYIIAHGKDFELKWEVENASGVELYKNEERYRSFNDGQTSVWLREEVYDGKLKQIKYTLVALNDTEKTEKSIVADIVVPYIAPVTPEIKDFSVKNYSEKNGNQYTITSGKIFELQWEVTNATRIEINRNGEPYQQLDKDEKSIKLKEITYDGNEKLIEYVLIASNSDNDQQEPVAKASLNVKVVFQSKIELDPLPPPPPPEENHGSINGDQLKKKRNKTVLLIIGCVLALSIIAILIHEINGNSNGVNTKTIGILPGTDTTLPPPQPTTDTTHSVVVHSYKYYDSLGEKYYKKGNFNEAIRYFDTSLQKNSKNAKAYYDRGMAKDTTKDVQGAIADYTKAINLNPNNSNFSYAYIYLGKAEYNSQHYDDAIAYYKKAIQFNRNDGRIYYLLAIVESDQNDATNACNDFEISCNLGYLMGCDEYKQHCKVSPLSIEERVNAHIKSGQNKYGLGDYKGAVDEYSKAIQLDGTYALAYYNRGFTELKINDHISACNDFDKGCSLKSAAACNEYRQECGTNLKDNKKDVDYNESGLKKFNRKDYKGAIEDYTKAIEVSPTESLYFKNRGEAKAALQEYSEAINDYNQAIELQKDYIIAYNDRGIAEIELGYKDDACRDFNTSCDRKDEDGCRLRNKYKCK